MGAGKSTVAAELGKLLGRPVFDSDAEIEAEAGMTIPEIFAKEGEASFRARERSVIASLAARGGVVALGGGAMAQPGAPEQLRAGGTVIYLRARLDTLARRVSGAATRPLLAGLDATGRRAKLVELLAARAPAYAQAHFTVDTDRNSMRRVAREIAALLGEATQ